MKETLTKVDPSLLAGAKTLEDSVNLAIGHNIRQNITDQEGMLMTFKLISTKQ